MPTGRQIHVDTPLSNLLVASFETQGDFVAQRLFPVVPVGKQSDKYYIIKKEAWLAIPNTRRSPKARANRIEFDVSSDAYYADNYALGAEIALEDLANADTALRLRNSNTDLVARGLLADYEVRVAATATASGNHVSAPVRNTTADAWDAVSSADLITQIFTGHTAIFNSTGLRANTLLLDYQSYLYAKQNARLFSRFQYRATGPALISDAQLLEAFNVDNLLIARSQKNNANTAQTASITSIWGPTALLCRVEPALSLQTATYGLSFRWTDPNLGVPMSITTAVEDGAGSRKIEVLEGGYYQDERVVAKDLAYYINTKSGTVW
jgi:hypothetical protein